MSKSTVTDVFESLGGLAKSTGQQTVTQVKKMGGDALESLGAKPVTPATLQTAQPPAVLSQDQVQKITAADKAKVAAGLQKIQSEIKAIEDKRKKEIPKQVSGKPGFDEGKMVKQLETGKPAEEKKLPPLNVQRERVKAERFRGVSG